MRIRFQRGNVAAKYIAVAAMFSIGPALAVEPVETLAGAWSGSGRITYTDGSSESIRCTSYYTGSGTNLRMAIQCQSDRNPIHIRSSLRIDGRRATGQWEERTFNASGSASGSVGSNSMSLSVAGGGFNGTMNVSFSRSSHSVTITTEGIAMRRASMQMSRR
jgi:hypothetical protein